MRAAMRRKKLFLLDMDGTLYLGDRVFDHCLDFLRAIRRQGGRYLYLTNNSSKSVDKYVEKMERLHIPAAAEDFFTSTDAACAYLREHYHGRKIYALGTASFRQQLQGAGFPVTDRLEDDVDCLLMGFDTELTFQKLEDACILLNRGVEYVATNPDWVCPTWYGSVPDCGSVAEMLYRATGRRPLFIGKPEPDMVELAVKETDFTKEQTILLGDRLYTDIKSGVRAGVDTVLVLSGEATLKDLAASDVKPTYVMKDIREFLNNLTE